MCNWIACFNPDSFFPDARILGAGFLPADGHTRPRRFFAALTRLCRFCGRLGRGVHIFADTGLILADLFIGYGYG